MSIQQQQLQLASCSGLLREQHASAPHHTTTLQCTCTLRRTHISLHPDDAAADTCSNPAPCARIAIPYPPHAHIALPQTPHLIHSSEGHTCRCSFPFMQLRVQSYPTHLTPMQPEPSAEPVNCIRPSCQAKRCLCICATVKHWRHVGELIVAG